MKADGKKKAGGKVNGEPEKLPKGKLVQREIIAWFWVILAFLLVNGAVGQARVIPSASMENTLLIGDHVIMSRIGYDAGVPFTHLHLPLWRHPHRQQLIVFRPPIPGDPPDWVKRVIALPGDTVDIHDNSVWINGQRLKENYTLGQTQPGAIKLPYTVPANCYFMMGDNREDSYDSRYVGCVPRRNIIGAPILIYMSVDAPEQAWDSGQIRERLYAYMNAVLHPGEIRWRRLFHSF